MTKGGIVMRKIRKNNKRGFTLIELIIVIVIAVIFLAIIIPPIVRAISDAQEFMDYCS